MDSTAIVAAAVENDVNHSDATRLLDVLIALNELLWTHNYVIVEPFAVIQRELGLEAALTFQAEFTDFAMLHWITEDDHRLATRRLRERSRQPISLVNYVSFIVMEKYGCRDAFAYDSEFQTEGFNLVG